MTGSRDRPAVALNVEELRGHQTLAGTAVDADLVAVSEHVLEGQQRVQQRPPRHQSAYRRAMPKIIKGFSSRVPPVAGGGHELIEEWLSGVMPAVHPLVAAIDELICETVDGLEFAVKWSKAHYGIPEHGWVIELSAYHRSANVLFFFGSELDPPPPLGEVDTSRYLKLTDVEQVADPQLRTWIAQAATGPGWS